MYLCVLRGNANNFFELEDRLINLTLLVVNIA